MTVGVIRIARLIAGKTQTRIRSLYMKRYKPAWMKTTATLKAAVSPNTVVPKTKPVMGIAKRGV